MRRYSRLLLLLIIVITILSVLVNIPKNIDIKIGEPVNIRQQLPGFNPNFSIGSFHFEKDLAFKKGLDLEGGTAITLRADMKDIPAANRDAALESAKTVIERRVNFYGVSEPVVQTAKTNNDYRILVEIPGVTDVNQAVNLVGRTAKLTFWEAASSAPKNTASPSALPKGIAELIGPDAKPTNLSGSDLKEASVAFDPQTGLPQVQLVFTPEGGQKFAEITGRNIGRILPIVLDDQVIQQPVVNERIVGGNAVINGQYTTQEAKALTVQLNAGALPVSLTVLNQHAIGATLGSESLQKSLFAGIIGFIVIVAFMCVQYGRLGVIASIALGIYTLIVLALFRLIPITLTLAGIAGLILSIGIAVDANILIFERTIEEMRKGRSREISLDIGFSRAWTSIRDSNMASLITSAILYYFGTGMIRGFAVTLALGVLVSMFSAITVTRTLLAIFYRDKK
jgi:preprotein translocase subunit SecD